MSKQSEPSVRYFAMRDEEVERASAWLANLLPGVSPRPASTVILLRPSEVAPFEIYMVRRSPTMAHTPGVSAFPGGSLNPDDADAALSWHGPDAGQWAQMLQCGDDLARGHLLAAAREVFEETRVMLALREGVPVRVEGPQWEEARRAVESHERPFGNVLREESLTLDFSSVGYRGTWTGPDFLERRYCVAFFTACVPAAQEPFLASTEATKACWGTPQSFLDMAERREIALVAPTRIHLEELAECSSIEQALEHKPRQVKFEPVADPDASNGYALRWNR